MRRAAIEATCTTSLIERPCDSRRTPQELALPKNFKSFITCFLAVFLRPPPKCPEHRAPSPAGNEQYMRFRPSLPATQRQRQCPSLRAGGCRNRPHCTEAAIPSAAASPRHCPRHLQQTCGSFDFAVSSHVCEVKPSVGTSDACASRLGLVLCYTMNDVRQQFSAINKAVSRPRKI